MILIFVDGFGIGPAAPSNPLAAIDDFAPLTLATDLENTTFMGGIVVPTDARLSVEGRPQSASGQTTILTGVNAPQTLGYHKQGFPNRALRDIIEKHSIFLRLKQREIYPNVFVNAYSPKFFKETPRWKSATTCAVEAAGMQFQRFPDLIGRKALSHDFTNRYLIDEGFDVPELSPEEAGSILARISMRHRFTLYEHFITDMIGHAQDEAAAAEHLPKLARFIHAVIETADLKDTTVILTSDHGNIEDLSIRNHTLNDVPTIVWGRESESTAASIKDLTHITPAIIRLLTE